jgi:hypothetical protein
VPLPLVWAGGTAVSGDWGAFRRGGLTADTRTLVLAAGQSPPPGESRNDPPDEPVVTVQPSTTPASPTLHTPRPHGLITSGAPRTLGRP